MDPPVPGGKRRQVLSVQQQWHSVLEPPGKEGPHHYLAVAKGDAVAVEYGQQPEWWEDCQWWYAELLTKVEGGTGSKQGDWGYVPCTHCTEVRHNGSSKSPPLRPLPRLPSPAPPRVGFERSKPFSITALQSHGRPPILLPNRAKSPPPPVPPRAPSPLLHSQRPLSPPVPSSQRPLSPPVPSSLHPSSDRPPLPVSTGPPNRSPPSPIKKAFNTSLSRITAFNFHGQPKEQEEPQLRHQVFKERQERPPSQRVMALDLAHKVPPVNANHSDLNKLKSSPFSPDSLEPDADDSLLSSSAPNFPVTTRTRSHTDAAPMDGTMAQRQRSNTDAASLLSNKVKPEFPEQRGRVLRKQKSETLRSRSAAEKKESFRLTIRESFLSLVSSLDPDLCSKKRAKQEERLLRMVEKGSALKDARKGKLTQDAVDWLLLRASTESSTHKELLLSTLVACAFPEEKLKGVRMKILQGGLLESLLKCAETDTIEVYNKIKPTEIQRISFIAEGAAAKVYKGKWKDRVVALKVFSSDNISFDETEFKRELAVLCLLEHPNLVPCYGACISSNEMIILTEYMSRGCLSDFLKESRKLDVSECARLALDISKGVKWLHTLNLVHRDLKSANILLNQDLTCKIIDFGTSRVVAANNQRMTKNIGTPAWIAPEVFQNESTYGSEADVYSFAILMWELLTCELPYGNLNVFEIPDAVCKGKRPDFNPADSDEEYTALMCQAWDPDPAKRPTMEQLEVGLTKIVKRPVIFTRSS